MQPRINHPAMVLTDAMPALQAVGASVGQGGLPPKTIQLVNVRASHINGCAVCLEGDARSARKEGETDERLFVVAGWRDAPYFTDAERAALALTEAVTRLSDQADPVTDEIWNEAARHFNEKQLASLLLMIGVTNLFNRMNVPTKQPAGVTTW